MPLQSDVTVKVAKFDPKNVTEKTANLNEELLRIDENGPNWWEVGAPKYRQMRLDGETPLPIPKVLPDGKDINIPSRDPHRPVPCRLINPTSSPPTGVIIHIHGGGWALMSEKTSDPLLKFYADTTNCAVVSIGYRLAPEDPFPAGVEDCFDVADWLVKNSEKYGGPVRFMGGESAGAHLSLLTSFHLLRTFPSAAPPALLLHFGVYDLSLLPSCSNITKPPILDLLKMHHFIKAFLPNISVEGRKSPTISPFYENLEDHRGRLPQALFTCGTRDCLVDDSVMMAVKWQTHGGVGVLRIYEGAPHAFLVMLQSDEAKKCLGDIKEFIQDVLGN